MANYQIDNKKIANNTLALYFRMAFTMLVSFFTTRLTLQVLGVDDFGLNNLVSSIVALFSFLNASLGTAVQRFYSIEIGKNNIQQLKKIFGCALFMHILVALITIVLMEIFAIFFLSKLNIPQERIYAAQIAFQISIISLAFNIISVPYSAMLRAKEQFSTIAGIDILQAIFRLGILYLLYTINYDKLITLSILNFIISILYVISLIHFARKEQACHSTLCYDKTIISGMLKFISVLIITVLASIFRDKGIVLLINIFFGLAINAAYAVAMQVMTLTNTFVTNFKQSIVPQMMASYGYGDTKTMHQLINMGTKITFLLMLLISVPLIFESDYVLKLWLSSVPEHTSKLVILAIINVNISSYTYFMYQGVHATGNIVKQQILYSLLYLLNIALIYMFFYYGYNYTSALYVTIIISIAQCIINLYFAKTTFNYNVNKFTISILPRCIITIVVYLVGFSILKYIMNASFLRLSISLFLSAIISLTTGYYIIFNNEERTSIFNMLKKLLKK